MAGKADIVESVVDSVEGMTKKTAGEALEAILDCITGQLANGEKVQLPGFGTFSVSERAARQGRNPRTGETLTIPASKGAKFKAGKALKDAVNG